MHLLALLLPSLAVAVLTVLAAVPLGLEAGGRLIMPLLPVLAIGHFAIRRPEHLPAAIVFAAGLALDVATHGPLGYWSLVNLAAYLAGSVWLARERASLLDTWARLAAVMPCAAAAEWLVHSLYFAEPAPIAPRLLALAAALAAYPLLALLLAPFEQPARRRRQLQLERGS